MWDDNMTEKELKLAFPIYYILVFVIHILCLLLVRHAVMTHYLAIYLPEAVGYALTVGRNREEEAFGIKAKVPLAFLLHAMTCIDIQQKCRSTSPVARWARELPDRACATWE